MTASLWIAPEHNCWDPLGLVHNVHGNNNRAAECYRQVMEFIRSHPDDYDSGMIAQLAQLADRLDSPIATRAPALARAP